MTCGIGARRTRKKPFKLFVESHCIVAGDLPPSHISILLSFPEDGPSISKLPTHIGEVLGCFIPLPLCIVYGLLGSTCTVEDMTSSLQATVPERNFSNIVMKLPFAQPTGLAIMQNKVEFINIVPPLSRIGCGVLRWEVGHSLHLGNTIMFSG